MMETLDRLINEWRDPLGANTMSDAEDLIHMLLLEVAAKEQVIKMLHNDIRYYRNDWKDQMIQDQGLGDD